MFQWTTSKHIHIPLRIIMGLIMIYAGAPKLFAWGEPFLSVDFSGFARSIYNYRVLPVSLTNLAAFTIAPFETITGLCLVLGIWVRPASLGLGILQLAFLAGMVAAIVRGLDISCGCFAGLESKVGLYTLIRDGILFLGMVFVFVGTYQNSNPERIQQEPNPLLSLDAEPGD